MSAPSSRIVCDSGWTAASTRTPGPAHRRLTLIDATGSPGEVSGILFQEPERESDRSGTTFREATMASLLLASLAIGVAPPTSASTPGLIPLSVRPVRGGEASALGRASATTWPEGVLSRLHARTRLTWEQIARLMGVDRRTIHLWLTGTQPRGPRAERLSRVMQVVEGFGGLTPEEIRGRLLEPGTGGQPSLFETLVMQAAGMSIEVQAATAPSSRKVVDEAPLVKWLDARTDVVAVPEGRTLRRRPTREPRRG